jgi:hypothetical protein
MSFPHLPRKAKRELQTKINGSAVSERRNTKLVNLMSVGAENRYLKGKLRQPEIACFIANCSAAAKSVIMKEKVYLSQYSSQYYYSSSTNEKHRFLLQSTERFLTACPKREKTQEGNAVQDLHNPVMHMSPIMERKFHK